MKKHRLFIGIALITAVLALGAIACSDDDDEDDGDGVSAPTATEAAPSDGETPADGGDETPVAEGQTIEVIMEAQVDSGVTGTATITETATGFDVEMTIDGGLTEGEHINHIHVGTCEAQGDIVVPLTPLQADASGATEPTMTSVDQPLSDFTGGNNYFAAHATDGTVVTCGNIPAA